MSGLILVSNGDIQRSNRICSQDQMAKNGQYLTNVRQNHSKSPKVNMLKSGDVSFDFGFEWCLGAASGYVAKISMLILATYPAANSPSWPPCPGMFGTLFGTFGTFGTSGTFGTFLDPGNTVRVQHRLPWESHATCQSLPRIRAGSAQTSGRVACSQKQ